MYTAHGAVLEDQGFRSAVGRDLKAAAPGLGQQTAQQRMDIDHSVRGAEKRVVKFETSQEWEPLSCIESRQELNGYAMFEQWSGLLGGSRCISMEEVQAPGLGEHRTFVNGLHPKLTNALNR